MTTVDDAYLTPVSHGPLGTLAPPRRWFRGTVYDARGSLVKSAVRLGGVNGYNWASADEGRIRKRRPDTESLDGTWLYGGHWIQHFGHFVIETVSTLWPQVEVQGLVFHKYLKRPWSVEPWQERLLDLAGYGGLPVRVVDGRAPLRVERLVVPGRAVVAHGWAHPQAVAVWDLIARPFRGSGASPRRVYLSRTAHNKKGRELGHRSAYRSSAKHDKALDRVFSHAGFDVIHPETLTLDEQLATVAAVELLAGPSGSALHLSAFAPPSVRVLEVGDLRSPNSPLLMQLVIDAACGHQHCFIRGNTEPAEVAAELKEALA